MPTEYQVGDVPRKMTEMAQEFDACRPLFTALGDENRQRIVITLLENFSGMRVGAITQHTHLSRPAVSHHLKVLREAGVISLYRRGTMNFYYMNEKNERWAQLTALVGHMNELVADIAEKMGAGVCFPSDEE